MVHVTTSRQARESTMSLRASLPQPTRQWIRSAYVSAGSLSAGLRLRPDMIVIGGQRCGTTSLFRALEQHPQVVRPTLNKGINYFDLNYHRGPRWYAGHFPLAWLSGVRAGKPPLVTFEASGYYMFHPMAAERIARDLPEIKIVALLRDPIERAYSAWKHEKARGYESEDFQTALLLEEDRTRGEAERMTLDPHYQSQAYRHQAYAARGEYSRQLRAYYSRFPASQIHIMYSEDFFANPRDQFGNLSEFLGLSPKSDIIFDQHNARRSGSMPPASADFLCERFSSESDELERLVGRRPPWDTGQTLSAEPEHGEER